MLLPYFQLQCTRTSRGLALAGLHPALAIPLLATLFPLAWIALYAYTELSSLLAVFLGIVSALRLSKSERDDFLMLTFGTNRMRVIRLVENALVSLPFVGVLVVANELLYASLLMVVSLILAVSPLHVRTWRVLPTPFARYPFEFPVGFRVFFLAYPLAYALATIGMYANNVNLSLFAILLLYLVHVAFYTTPEPDVYVWVHRHSPAEFLRRKLGIAMLFSLAPTLPLAVAISVWQVQSMWLAALMLVVGSMYLTVAVLAKYAAFPHEQGPTEGVVQALCLVLPPLLLAAIPFLYSKALKSLYLLHHDPHPESIQGLW